MVTQISLTLNQIIAADLFLGYHVSNWNPRINYFLIGKYKYSNIFNINYSYNLIKKFSSIILDLLIKKTRIWLVNENFGIFKQSKEFTKLKSFFKELGFYNEKWYKGLLSNYKYVRLIKPYKFPHAIFVPNMQNNHFIINEAFLINIPSFAVVDSIDNPLNVFLPLPGNSKSVKSIFFFYLFVCKLALHSRYLISSSFVFSLYNKSKKKNKAIKFYSKKFFLKRAVKQAFFKNYLEVFTKSFLFSKILILLRSSKVDFTKEFVKFSFYLIRKKKLRVVNKKAMRWHISLLFFTHYFNNLLKGSVFKPVGKSAGFNSRLSSVIKTIILSSN